MKKKPSREGASITPFCRANLEIQGVVGFSDEELLTHRAGFRFAYQMCFAITLLGTVFQSIGHEELGPASEQIGRGTCAGENEEPDDEQFHLHDCPCLNRCFAIRLRY